MAETLPPVRIGTRRSKLAIVQAEGILNDLKKIAPNRTYEIVTLHTAGDRDESTALYEINAKSLWTTDLEEKLVSGDLDIIVHCLKDMPTKLPQTCELAAIPPRDSPHDALIIKSGLPYTNLKDLPKDSIVGTSSVRRSAQLRRLFPHLRFANLRGNVDTRLAKVDDPDSEYTCMIMSAAGLERLGLGHRINQYLRSKDGGIFYAVGQGALGLEIRKGDEGIRGLVEGLGDVRSTLACLAERALLRTLEGGCSVPIGVQTEWVGGELGIEGVVVSLDGRECVRDGVQAEVSGVDEAEALGVKLAARLVEGGAESILKDIVVNRPAKE